MGYLLFSLSLSLGPILIGIKILLFVFDNGFHSLRIPLWR